MVSIETYRIVRTRGGNTTGVLYGIVAVILCYTAFANKEAMTWIGDAELFLCVMRLLFALDQMLYHSRLDKHRTMLELILWTLAWILIGWSLPWTEKMWIPYGCFSGLVIVEALFLLLYLSLFVSIRNDGSNGHDSSSSGNRNTVILNV